MKNLKPITVLLYDTVKLYKKHMNLLGLISVIPFIFGGVRLVLYRQELATSVLAVVLIIVTVSIFSVLYFIFGLILPLALTEAVNEVHGGKTPDPTHVYSKVFKHSIPYLLVFLFSVITVLGGYVILIIPGLIAGVYISFAMYTYYFEDKHGLDALITSAWYVRGLWWQIFARRIALILVLAAVMILFMLVVGGLVLGLGFGPDVFSFLVSLFASMIMVPFAMTFSYLLYKDVKSVKENHTPDKNFVDEAEKMFIILVVIAALAALIFFFMSVMTVPGPHHPLLLQHYQR
jgi:hypothetical protein